MGTTTRIALITGGSRGLGKNSALHIAWRGIDVILTYRSKKEEAEATVTEIVAMGRKAAALQLDTGEVKSFEGFSEQLLSVLKTKWEREQFDFLINNAGIDAPSLFGKTKEDDFDNLVNVHFKGVYFLTQTLLPVIADGGRIINLSSGLTRFSSPGYAAYASMKGAIEVFTRYLAKELGPRQITANTVAPGIIETDFTAEAFSHPGMRELMSKATALGRPGIPDDIGSVIAFLCTDDARWINAQRIEASGGMFL
ncbi:SDR family NAD(P)-dependent oxidoreductase [Mucilaginibacter sp. X4EP1]|uniref:SDR family NAD(P)-dependent oxidoreductase n=1 Tax=Mucilaginibacter sp. X4EP1 TaxID=2723092 RepID=UPI0021683C14|nr:SDR family oxidoreductase [Mucilaginibacter sp. X4EP1]MCS3811981.1 NAD(P)-dependent dehydrogenase (short-subunit alcohol dehydrogenase family) [Mucilaginibacter sp. X4EP1]